MLLDYNVPESASQCKPTWAHRKKTHWQTKNSSPSSRAYNLASVTAYLTSDSPVRSRTLIFAATDTTSNALTLVLECLATHPEAQEKLRAELREAKRRHESGDLPYDELMSLPYLHAVCSETLRVYVSLLDPLLSPCSYLKPCADTSLPRSVSASTSVSLTSNSPPNHVTPPQSPSRRGPPALRADPRCRWHPHALCPRPQGHLRLHRYPGRKRQPRDLGRGRAHVAPRALA